jgi:hypothetical protein
MFLYCCIEIVKKQLPLQQFEKDCLAIGIFGNHQDAEEAIKEQ